ncbi:hypothetical protein LOTGIDRAFT_231686 [Lottia gigantea]|uniref:Serine protease n=1 Tax=Lottia gigantea TaxID=225164 RepID=V4C5J6_LOTGI|nr:hypothetical protein LOTGIDRAFT_231686 [Lottia gigantea]ESO96864.1 hypothetical protein LOTGIDRAFT_231686 [Lottia gigantea]
MEFEVAREAFSDLSTVPACTKNPNHEKFIKFDEFKVEDLPEDMRREEIYQYIKNIGLRVVRLTVKKDDESTVWGTGVVYKAGIYYGILTNDHVVASQTDVENCTIDFFYHTEGQPLIQSKGQALQIGSAIQDKSIFTFSPIPESLERMKLKDNSDSLAQVTLIFDDGSKSTVVGCIAREMSKWFVLVPRDNQEQIVAVEVVFFEAKTGRSYLYEAGSELIDVSDPKAVQIEVPDDNVPQFVKDFTFDKFKAPWPKGNGNFTPLVIAHPHGGPKTITMGKLLDFEDRGRIALIHHTAETCPGSSGGLLITLGGDTSSYCEFCNTVGVHCEGQKVEEYKGMKLDNGNLNVSLFNNS